MDIYDASQDIFFGTQPTPDDLEILAAQGVRTIINLRLPGEDQPELPLDRAEAEVEAAGMKYFHVPIAAIELSEETVAEVSGALRKSAVDGSTFIY